MSGSHRFFAVRAGVLWTRYLDHLRISLLKSLRGNQVTPIALAWSLTLGIALDALAQTSLGFPRFEPVIGIVSPLSWAMLLTRQGISLRSVNSAYAER